MPYRQLLILGVSAAWLLGSWLALLGVTPLGWWAVTATGLAGAAVWRYRRGAGLTLLLVCALLGGLARAAASHSAGLTAAVGQSVTLVGTVSADPTQTPKGLELTLQPVRLNGRTYNQPVWVFTYPQRFQRGYRLVLQGKLKPGFGPYAAELSYPRTLGVDTRQNWLERLRQRFFAGVRTALPEPVASFVLGLLVGVRALIPKPLQVQLARTGLSHLVAVSGYNLTIIAQAVYRLTGRLGRNVSLVITLWLIGGFVVLTGAPASIVRAAVVAVMVLAAGRYGRRVTPLNLIVLAAALTAAWQPDYLHDLGWLLSFTAFFGIVVLAPAIERRLGLDGEVVTPGADLAAKPRSGWRQTLLKLLIESTCAQLMTLPLLMHNFGQLSVVAPLANLLILPLVPLAMLLGFLAGLAGIWLPAFCGWLSWPALLLAKGILALVGWLSGLNFASLAQGLSPIDAWLMYGLLGILAAALWFAPRRPAIAR